MKKQQTSLQEALVLHKPILDDFGIRILLRFVRGYSDKYICFNFPEWVARYIKLDIEKLQKWSSDYNIDVEWPIRQKLMPTQNMWAEYERTGEIILTITKNENSTTTP